jgi:hypothetical protein
MDNIYIISQCASSGTPGQEVLIQNAFFTFERNYCNLTSAIGTTTSLYNGITAQIPNLSNLPQLMNNSLPMSELPRWITSVNNIGDSITNLWVTIADMRSAIIQIASTVTTVPCILLPPESMIVNNITDTSADISWEISTVEGIELPVAYSIQIYTLADTGFTSPVVARTRSQVDGVPNTINIQSNDIVQDEEYVIRIFCIYSCGNSLPISLTSILTTNPIP